MIFGMSGMSVLHAQVQRPLSMTVYTGAPSGTCINNAFAMNGATYAVYQCNAGSWTLLNGGSSLTVAGTSNQVNTSGCSPVSLGGTCTLSTPQSIATSSTPQFARLGLGAAAGATALVNLNGGTLHSIASNIII